MIRLERVTREYRPGAHPVSALREVDLNVREGEFVVLMGPSGSGKSTLLNVIGCLDRPTSGKYFLDGDEVTALPDKRLVRFRREKLGFVFQAFHLVPRMTALRNVELPMVFEGTTGKERRERAMRSLSAVGLSDRVSHRPDELSGGEKQRVAIARALVMDPPVLLADEPTGNLDSKSGGEIINLLKELNRKGRTVLMVTHNQEYAGVGHRRIRLRDGRIEKENGERRRETGEGEGRREMREGDGR